MVSPERNMHLPSKLGGGGRGQAHARRNGRTGVGDGQINWEGNLWP